MRLVSDACTQLEGKASYMRCVLYWLSIRCTVVAACVCSIIGAQAQTPNPEQSWIASGQTITGGTNPSRITESHTKSGNHTFDRKSVEVLGTDNRYELHYDIE